MAKRLNIELEQINSNSIDNIKLIETNNNKWIFIIEGPSETPYEKGKFKLSVEFPKDYPYSAPTILFLTRIYHPNINSLGQICLDILKNQWSPILTINKVLISICSLLSEPNPDDPLEIDIAKVMKENYDEYKKKVKEYIEKYCEK